MTTEIERNIQQRWLGLKPYILIETDLENPDEPEFTVAWGGGVIEGDIGEVLGILAEQMGYLPGSSGLVGQDGETPPADA